MSRLPSVHADSTNEKRARARLAMGAVYDHPHPAKYRSFGRPMLAGLAAVALGLGGFVTFSAMVPVASAVVASGVVANDTDRKKLQHLEGGIVREIRVREGETVREGAVLLRMEPLQAEVNAEILLSQIASAEALEARLIAERDGADRPRYPETAGESPAGRQARSDQDYQFTERRAALQGEIGVLEARLRQFEDQIAGYRREREAGEIQLKLIESELADARKLYEQRLIARPRLLSLEREQARLVGMIGQADANMARIRNAMEEEHREIGQVLRSFNEKVGEELRATRERLAELHEKAKAAREVLARVEIKAPSSGVVQDLKVSTIGQVVQAGDILLEIAPTEEELVVNARIRPQDVDGLLPEMDASLRFVGLPSRTTSLVQAHLISVSRDRLVDETTGEAYFLARARLAGNADASQLGTRIIAGMPVELIVPTRERTLISYLLEPLSDALVRAFREQ